MEASHSSKSGAGDRGIHILSWYQISFNIHVLIVLYCGNVTFVWYLILLFWFFFFYWSPSKTVPRDSQTFRDVERKNSTERNNIYEYCHKSFWHRLLFKAWFRIFKYCLLWVLEIRQLAFLSAGWRGNDRKYRSLHEQPWTTSIQMNWKGHRSSDQFITYA